jgi:hypothetical protein
MSVGISLAGTLLSQQAVTIFALEFGTVKVANVAFVKVTA